MAGRNVAVEYDKRDRYGRIIGKILRDGQDMNLQQIKDGFAWHYKRYQNEQSSIDRVLYSAAEDQARARKIGLWSVPGVPPWEYRRASKK